MAGEIQEGLTPDTLASIGAVFVAIIALGYSIFETHLNRKHHRLSVTPNLAFHTSSFPGFNGEDFIGIALENKGIGPARIKSFEIFLDGELVSPNQFYFDGGWQNALEKLGWKNISFKGEAIAKNGALRTGEKVWLFELKKDLSPEQAKTLISILLTRLDIRINYESFYEEDFWIRWNQKSPLGIPKDK